MPCLLFIAAFPACACVVLGAFDRLHWRVRRGSVAGACGGRTACVGLSIKPHQRHSVGQPGAAAGRHASRCRPLRCIGNFHALSWPWRCWRCWPRSMPRCCRSRGGWLALLLAIPLVLVLFQRLRPGRLFRILAGILVALTLVTALNWEMVETRWHLMRHECRSMAPSGRQTTRWAAAGALALCLGCRAEKPLTGWGMAGYLQDKARRVAAGQYQPAIMEYIYAHNEVLDVFVKTGLVGGRAADLLWGADCAVLAQSAPLRTTAGPARSVEGADGGCASVRAVHSCVVHGLWAHVGVLCP